MLNDLALAVVSATAFRGLYRLAALPLPVRELHPRARPRRARPAAGAESDWWWTPLARATPIGYLAHDAHLIWTEPSLWEVFAAAHHAVFALLVFFAAGSFPDHTARAFLAELLVFPLNLGWAMIKTGADSRWPRLFMANSVALLLTFLRFRVYAFTLITVEAVTLKAWALLPMVAGLAGLNWYWFTLLCQKARAVARSERPAVFGHSGAGKLNIPRAPSSKPSMSTPADLILDRFASSDRHDFLSSVARTLTAIADGNPDLLEPLRNRVNAERRVIRIERARTMLETWAVATGGSFTVTAARRYVDHAEWRACVVLSYKDAKWIVNRVGHTEAGALDLALSGAAAESGPWVEYLDKGVKPPRPSVRRQWHHRRASSAAAATAAAASAAAAPLSASAPSPTTPPVSQAAPAPAAPKRQTRDPHRPPWLGTESLFTNNPFAVLWTAVPNGDGSSTSSTSDDE